jgi:hypothetical protein
MNGWTNRYIERVGWQEGRNTRVCTRKQADKEERGGKREIHTDDVGWDKWLGGACCQLVAWLGLLAYWLTGLHSNTRKKQERSAEWNVR